MTKKRRVSPLYTRTHTTIYTNNFCGSTTHNTRVRCEAVCYELVLCVIDGVLV